MALHHARLCDGEMNEYSWKAFKLFIEFSVLAGTVFVIVNYDWSMWWMLVAIMLVAG